MVADEKAKIDAAADKAVVDAKAAADDAKAAAEAAKADEYASDADKQEIDAKKADVEAALGAVDELPKDATAQQKNDAAKAVEGAVAELNAATDKANINSAAERAATETSEKALENAKSNAPHRLSDVYSAKNLSDYKKAQKKELKNAKAAGDKAIKAATTPEAVNQELLTAKKAINAVKTKAQKAQEAYNAAAKKAKAVKVKIKKPKALKGKRITATWKKASGASGYQIACSTSKKFSKKTTKTFKVGSKVTKRTIRSLKAGKKYYVKVRSFKVLFNPAKYKNGRVYGKWSKVKAIKVK